MPWTCRAGHKLQGPQKGSKCPFCADAKEAKRRQRILGRAPRKRSASLHALYRLHACAKASKGRLAAAFPASPVERLYALWQEWKTDERLLQIALDRRANVG